MGGLPGFYIPAQHTKRLYSYPLAPIAPDGLDAWLGLKIRFSRLLGAICVRGHEYRRFVCCAGMEKPGKPPLQTHGYGTVYVTVGCLTIHPTLTLKSPCTYRIQRPMRAPNMLNYRMFSIACTVTVP